MNGGSIISDDMTKATVNEPAAVEAVKFYTDMLHRARRLAALDAAERRHRQPPALHRRDGRDVPVRPVRHRLDPQGEPQHRHRRDDDPASGGQGDRGDPRRLELRHPEGRARTPRRRRSSSQFLAESDNMGFFTDTFPARISAMELPRFEDPILANFKAMLPHGRRVPPHKNWVQITQAYFDGIQRILLGDAGRRRRRWTRPPRRSRRCWISRSQPNELSSSGARSATRGSRGKPARPGFSGLRFASPENDAERCAHAAAPGPPLRRCRRSSCWRMLIAYPIVYTGAAQRHRQARATCRPEELRRHGHGAGDAAPRSGTRSTTSAARSCFQVLLGTAAGILLNQNFRGRGVVRSLTLIPWVVPGIVAATTWAWMFHTEFGIINYMLTAPHADRRAGRLADQPRHRACRR